MARVRSIPPVDLRAPVPPSVADAVVQAGRRLDARGWVPATAGNLSQRLDQNRIAITRSSVHKGFLTAADVIVVGLDGAPEDPAVRPSAETLLHCQIYRRFPQAGAVLHGHSVPGTVLSMQPGPLRFQGYEVHKAFEGQTTHEAALDLPIVDNDQDIARLAGAVEKLLGGIRLGYLIRGHGTYVWGPDMPTALARFEGLEFLLSCELERRRLT